MKPVSGFEDYNITEAGVITKSNGKIVSQRIKKNSPFLICELTRDKKQVQQFVHRLVALTFLSKPPNDEDYYVAHIGNIHDNNFKNLVWKNKKEEAQQKAEARSEKLKAERKIASKEKEELEHKLSIELWKYRQGMRDKIKEELMVYHRKKAKLLQFQEEKRNVQGLLEKHKISYVTRENAKPRKQWWLKT